MITELQKVWELVARNDQLRYFALNHTTNLAGTVNSVSKLNTLIDTNPSFNWYVTLNPTRARASLKARSRDVLEWAWILLDIDPVSSDADPQAALDFVLDKHHLRAYCALLDSGRGRQAWVRLRPMPLTGDRSHVEVGTKAWLRSLGPCGYGCRIDTACSDLARVARLPGTINLKTGRVSKIVSLPDEQLDPVSILEAAPHEPPRERVPDLSLLSSDAPLSALLPHLTETACNFLTQGVSEPGRHSACYATARSLLEAGVPLDKATALSLRGSALCSPSLPIRDTVRAVRQAYERGTA